MDEESPKLKSSEKKTKQKQKQKSNSNKQTNQKTGTTRLLLFFIVLKESKFEVT